MRSRRDFSLGFASLAFGGLTLGGCGRLGDLAQRVPGFRTGSMASADPYRRSNLRQPPELDLPRGFTCEIVSELGEKRLYQARAESKIAAPNPARRLLSRHLKSL